jgi:hypothetical protein
MKSPVYMMTGDLETARFYSMLASSSSRFGYFLEDVITENINLPIVDWDRLPFCEVKSVCRKPKINRKIPDFLLIDPINMLVWVAEIKTNLNSLDSKQCKSESTTYLTLKADLQTQFPKHKVEVNIVNFFGGKNSRGNLIHPELNIITGEEFCEVVGVSYGSVLGSLSANRVKNATLISEYKERPVVITEQDNERQGDISTLEAFL